MRNTLLLILATMCGTSIHAQESNIYYEMINTTIEKYVDNTLSENQDMRERGIGVGKINFSEWYIDLEGFPRDFEFSQKIRDMGFSFIHVYEQGAHKIFKKSRATLFLFEPLLKGNTFKISVHSAGVQAKSKHQYYLAFNPDEGPFYCIWEYSCETGEWVLKKSGRE